MPPGTKIAANPPEIAKWESLSDDAKKVLSRQMEVYAGYAEHTDREIGRLIDAIEDLGELDNTIVIYIAGDNGGTAIGGTERNLQRMVQPQRRARRHPLSQEPNGRIRRTELLSELFGGLGDGRLHARTWCINACQGGGQNQGMVIRWPGGIKSKGEIRRQYTHLIDVGPTILEAVGIPEPKMVNGVEQIPMAGTSMIYSFDDAAAKDRQRPVQRVQRQSQHLQGRLDGLRDAPRAMGKQPARRRLRQGQVGALSCRRGFRPGNRSRRARIPRS